MLFGLKNAPVTFQRSIDIVLSAAKWQYAIVYLDHIIIFSKTLDEDLQHIKLVLAKLADAGFSLKLKKCYFLQSKVDYLGHIVSPGKLAVASKTCDAVQQMKNPRT